MTQENPYADKLLNCWINPTIEVSEPPAILSISGVPVFSLGETSLIIGRAKSRKTFLLTLLASWILPAQNGVVLYFDTEQGNYYSHKTIQRICRLLGDPSPDNLKAYSLRAETPANRLKLIDFAIETTPNLLCVFIDGVRDLVTDINDPVQATNVATQLLKWSKEKNIHVCSVLHMNKSKADTNARGHLGTELTNKAETVLSVNPDETGDFSTIESEYTRGLPIETFAIEVNSEGLPQWIDNFKKSESRQTYKPANLPEQLHRNVLEKLNGKEYNYSGIWLALQSGFKDYGHTFGVNKSKDLLKYYIEIGYILKLDIDGTKQTKYKVQH